MTSSFNQKDIALKKRIMRRVYLVWGIRALLHPVFLKALIVLVFFFRSTEYISYADVFANAPALLDVPHAFQFLQSAFTNTEISSLALLFGMGMVGIWIVTDFARKRIESFI